MQAGEKMHGVQQLDPPEQPELHYPSESSKFGEPEVLTSHMCSAPSTNDFRLVEGPPEFFLAANPSAKQLEAFKAFTENARVTRSEFCRKIQTESTVIDGEADSSASAEAKSTFLSRTLSRPMKGRETRAAATVPEQISRPAEDSCAIPTETAEMPDSEDAYPEVPELAGSTRLLRYFQGFDYDVTAASNAYRRHMKWREEMNLTSKNRRTVVESMLLPMRPEASPNHAAVTRFFPTNPVLRRDEGKSPSLTICAAAAAAASALGGGNSLLVALSDKALDSVILDKQGNIISIERPGLLDVNGLFSVVSENDFLRWHASILEFRCMLLDVLSRKFNRMVRITSIIDLQGLSTRILNRRALNLLRKTISSASENYPESIGTMYFINAPRTFSTLWSAIRGWLRERTINKIKLLSSDAENILVRNVGGYALPPSLGGTCTSAMADFPPLDTDLGPGSMILNVGARRCNQAVELVPQKSVVEWVWVAEDFDVGFSAIWRSQSGSESILEEHRKYPARKRVSGVVTAEQEGTLILSFDNSWGLISSRRVRYKIEVTPATQAGVIMRSSSDSSSVA
ncbi:Phosphatidylinositol transfer-like protein II, related [Eimeria tenella]|uniref:Phosphatidylinositol transfer-like protein II, related n=1 Tax=Eimeria tenella TaxID=5802 RepID=U6KZA8_EIMTE|nr:Phosphatidylinositol transfer-like protein II, related [Eimeria tenella]CDJ42268.1 Phosphatidylinositol transfer-like protein II, related [Eimeria tenella]|eukprot:XP_013233018.1 Phosphatidylinositol transfer-like protein II, related [Eimeria tenella]